MTAVRMLGVNNGNQSTTQGSNSKLDILSCLEISRIDSTRRPELVTGLINKLPG